MGLITGLLGIGDVVRRTSEVFVANRTERARQEHAEQVASLSQLGAEFAQTPRNWFDGIIDGLNRLPRPALALGTLGLFVFSMADPVAFGVRMQGLALVPEPLWWLLGAIVSFYFGARELHHFRGGGGVSRAAVGQVVADMAALRDLEPRAAPRPELEPEPEPEPELSGMGGENNAAVAAWRVERPRAIRQQ